MVNRILSSHNGVRAPIISDIVKISKSFFKQLHDQYASPETWAKAREILASCPTQRDLSTAWLDHWESCSGQHQQAKQSCFIFFGQLACQNGLIFTTKRSFLLCYCMPQTTALTNQNKGTLFNGDFARGCAGHGLGATSLTVQKRDK